MLYLARIELLPSVQGRGVGTQLMRQRIEQARRAGLQAVELDVLIVNGPARRLYERLGFRVVSCLPPKQRMRLDLTSGGGRDLEG